MTATHPDPTALWEKCLETLETTAGTRATFDQVIRPARLIAANGVYVIRAQDDRHIEWLPRMRNVISRAIATHTGQDAGDIKLTFVLPDDPNYLNLVSDNSHTRSDYLNLVSDNGENGSAAPAENYLNLVSDNGDQPAENENYLNLVSDNSHTRSNYLNLVSDNFFSDHMDYLSAYFTGGKKLVSGYERVAEYYTRFWAPLLGGSVFHLWLWLCSHDKRKLEDIEPNFWTPPAAYSYEEMAAALNRSHPRCIYGYANECVHSEKRRTAGQPFECCWNENWDRVWHKTSSRGKGGTMCLHWNEGWLETLHRHGLVRVELTTPAGRKPLIQTWRVLPRLSPAQVALLSPDLQRAHAAEMMRWSAKHEISRSDLETFTGLSMAPAQPGWTEWQIDDNFGQRRKLLRILDRTDVYANPDMECSSMRQALQDGFTWSETDDGTDYWRGIVDNCQ